MLVEDLSFPVTHHCNRFLLRSKAPGQSQWEAALIYGQGERNTRADTLVSPDLLKVRLNSVSEENVWSHSGAMLLLLLLSKCNSHFLPITRLIYRLPSALSAKRAEKGCKVC